MRAILLLLACLYSITGLAQVVFFNNVSQEDGLRNGNIRTVTKDYQGFMWIGTEDGLHRYDGYEMKIYRTVRGDSASLGSNTILSLFEDSHRHLWVGTLDGGLYLYNRKKDSFKRIELPSRAGNARNVAIRCITEGADHYLYIGSDDLARAKIDSTTVMNFTPVELPTDTLRGAGIRVTAMAQGPESSLLISISTQGLFLYDLRSGKCSPHEANSLESNVQTLYFDKRTNLLWVGSWGKGLLIYDAARKRHRRITSGHDDRSLRSDFLSAIAADDSGNIWMASENGVSVVPHTLNLWDSIGITTFLPGQPNARGLRGVAFKALCIDDRDRVWIGSYYEGLNVYDKHSMNFGSMDVVSEDNSLPGSGIVNALLEDHEGDLWMGLDGGGLYRLRGNFKGANYSNLQRLPISDKIAKVKALATDRDQQLWLGTWANGLWVMNVNTLAYSKINAAVDIGANIVSLARDRRDNLWIGSFDRGLFRYSPKDGDIEKITGVEPNRRSYDRIHAIHADSLGNIWIGKEANGLNLLAKGESSYKTIYTTHLDRSTTITTIFEDKSGRLWLGAPAVGLIEYDPATNKSYLYGEDVGLANSAIYAMEEDNSDRLWISHNAGLSVFDKRTKRFINFTMSNGITASQFNKNSVVKRKDGQIVFGNIRGLNYFNPDDFRKSDRQFPIVFTEFRINNIVQVPDGGVLNENITTARNIVLEHDENSFSLEFASLNYNFSHQTTYYYRLNGYEDAWRYAGDGRRIAYTNLEPGEYVCEVRLGNPYAGVESGTAARLRITIVPAWWQTTFFKMAIFIAFILTLFVLHRVRVRFLLHQTNRLENEVTARTKDLNQTVEKVVGMNMLLRAQQKEIVEKSNKIQAQNEEVHSQNEHIARQHDILIEAQEQLKLVNLHLEKTVEQRTETLQHTIDNLNKVVFELDRFVYSASHDLSAPLKSIQGLVNIINMEPDPGKVMEYVNLIKYTALKLDAVIKSMVDYARNAHMEIQAEPISLHELIQETLMELAFMPEAARMTFQNQVPRDLVIQNDPLRLKVIFSNLIGNSVKYHDKTKPESWIRIEALRMNAEWTQIKISDNGIGIRPEHIDKVFMMYFRATEHSKGSGLGLFIVKEMVTRLGGQIAMTTQFGEGTVFEIRVRETPADAY